MLRLGRWLVVMIVAMLTCGKSTGEWQGFSEYETIIKAWKREMTLPASIQCRYIIQHDNFKDNKRWLSLTNHVDYRARGSKYYSAATVERTSTEESANMGPHDVSLETGTASEERGYNGQMLRVRQLEGTVLQSQHPDRLAPMVPLPWTILELETEKTIGNLIELDKIQCHGVEEVIVDSKALLKATYIYKDTNGVFLELWHDPSQGCYPIHAKEYSRDGEVTIEISGVELVRIEVNSNQYIVPVKAERKHFQDGKIILLRKFEVDRPSIRLDEDIPDEAFTLRISPGDRLFDLDSGRVIWDPNDRDGYLNPMGSIEQSGTGSAMNLLPDNDHRSTLKPTNAAASGAASVMNDRRHPSSTGSRGRYYWPLGLAITGIMMGVVLFLRKRRRSV